MRRLVWIVLLCLIQPAMVSAERLEVGIGELDYPPFYYMDEGRLTGAAVDITEDIAESLGHQLAYSRLPWARVQYFLKVGEIDMVMLYFKTPQREQDAVYVDQPHLLESSYLVVPKSMDVTFNGDLKALQQHRFLNVRGYSHGLEYDESDYLNKNAVTNETELLRQLVIQEDAVGVGNKSALTMYAERLGIHDKIRFMSPPIDQSPNYIAFSKARPDAEDLAKEFSQALKAYMQTPRYRQILDQYGID